jgi:hypothetical protein
VFLELGSDAGIDAVIDAGIDAIAVASETNAFVVEFVTVDAGAAALIARALQAPQPPAFAAATDLAPMTSDAVAALESGAADPAAVEDIPVVAGTPVSTSLQVAAFAAGAEAAPSWIRAFDADLGGEPEQPAASDTQRWPAAHATTGDHGPPTMTASPMTPSAPPTTAPTPPAWLGEVTPEPHELDWPSTSPPSATAEATAAPALQPTGFESPGEGRETTARWPAARVARVATPPQWSAPSTQPAPTTTAPSAPPTWLGAVTPDPTVPGPDRAPAEETTRWPVARAVASAPPPPTAPPPLSLDDAEDVVLEFTAPPRPAVVSRPLPAPEDAGIVEVDFSEFRDVLGVATFKTDAPQPIALQGPVSTPQPVAITLPRTPSMSRTPSAPGKSPFGVDSAAGPGPNATPPTVPHDAAATASAVEQWVVTSPGLPGPRLRDGGFDKDLRSKPVTPEAPPAVRGASTPATSSLSRTPAPFPTPMTTTPPMATRTPAPVARMPAAVVAPAPPPHDAVVPPPAMVGAPRPTPVVPVVAPSPPSMLTPRPRATTAGPNPAGLSSTRAATPAPSLQPESTGSAAPAPPAPQELPPISMDEHEVVTTPGGLARGVRRLD